MSLGVYLGRVNLFYMALHFYHLFRESANASWGIAQVSLKDEGFYECIAISSAGTGRAQTFLDVSG